MKLLLWLVLIAVVLHLLQGKKKPAGSRQSPHPSHSPRADTPAASEHGAAELMVRCDHCDLYLPASEAFSNARGVTYCSQEHCALHPPA